MHGPVLDGELAGPAWDAFNAHCLGASRLKGSPLDLDFELLLCNLHKAYPLFTAPCPLLALPCSLVLRTHPFVFLAAHFFLMLICYF